MLHSSIAMRKFVDHSRTMSAQTTGSGANTPPTQNPFATPPASVYGAASGFLSSDSSGTKYFRSRRIRKEDGYEPPVFKKDPKEKWLCIIPLMGVALGIVITGIMIYLKIGNIKSYNYCSVLSDDFSSGVLNPNIWQAEQEVGGFGYVAWLII
jgi:hypothetical protein